MSSQSQVQIDSSRVRVPEADVQVQEVNYSYNLRWHSCIKNHVPGVFS